MVLTQPKLIAQERFDLSDFQVLLLATTTDWKQHIDKFWGNQQYILKGFEVSAVGTPSPAQVILDGATLINSNNSGIFSFFVGPTGSSPISVNLTANSRNFLELQLSSVDGTPLPRNFWDQSANNGQGAEFIQTINTVTDLDIQVNVSVSGFSGSTNTIPLAIIDTDNGNNIKGILDRRPMFFRLGNPSNSQAGYTWNTQIEPGITLQLTGESGTFVAGETLTFSGGATATVQTGGTTTIVVQDLSSVSLASGNTVTGGTSGATGTLSSFAEAFDGADRSIKNLRDMYAALSSQIRAATGTEFWFQTPPASLTSLYNMIIALESTLDGIVVANPSDASTPGPYISWDGSALSITDGNGSPASSDIIALIRILGIVENLQLARQDGTGSTTTITIGSDSVLFVQLPSPNANTVYSGVGSGATNYQVVSRSSFSPTTQNFWLAYSNGSSLFFRGIGEIKANQKRSLVDLLSPPSWTSNIRGASTDSLYDRSNSLTDAMGDAQEDRSAYFRSDSPVTWSGTQLSFASNIILEILNTKSGTLTQHTILASASPLTLANGDSIYISINRTSASENVTPVNSSVTPIPAQTEANKDVFVLCRRIDVSGSGYLHIPFHKQVLNPGQTVRLGASGSGSGSGSGSINYLLNETASVDSSTFDSDIGNWVAYQNTAQATPVNGTGGTPTTTITRTITSPLRLSGSGLITKDANNRQGEGVSVNFSIDNADLAKLLSIQFDYIVASGAFTAGTDSTDSDIEVWVYDVTNSVLIPVTPFKLISGSSVTPGTFKGVFQTNYNSNSYRLILHIPTTNASAWALKFDNAVVGPQTILNAPSISDWLPYTITPTATVSNPTKGTATTDHAIWRRVGDSLEVHWEYNQAAGGSAGSGVYMLNLPPGLTVDTSKIGFDTSFQQDFVGTGSIEGGGLDSPAGVIVYTSTQLAMALFTSGSVFPWQASSSSDFASDLRVSMDARVPILGWSSNTVTGNDADARVTSFEVALAANLSVSASNPVIWDTLLDDTHGGWISATGGYKIPSFGRYRIAMSSESGAAASLYAVVNGTPMGILYTGPSTAIGSGSIELKLKSGDVVQFFTDSSVTFSGAGGLGYATHASISKLSGPALPLATETIMARYRQNSVQSIPNNTETVINFDTKVTDTHGTVLNPTTNWEFEAPRYGFYEFNVNATIAFAASGPASIHIGLWINGTQANFWESPIFGSTGTDAWGVKGAADTFELNAGDLVQVKIFQSTGGTVNMGNFAGSGIDVSIAIISKGSN